MFKYYKLLDKSDNGDFIFKHKQEIKKMKIIVRIINNHTELYLRMKINEYNICLGTPKKVDSTSTTSRYGAKISEYVYISNINSFESNYMFIVKKVGKDITSIIAGYYPKLYNTCIKLYHFMDKIKENCINEHPLVFPFTKDAYDKGEDYLYGYNIKKIIIEIYFS